MLTAVAWALSVLVTLIALGLITVGIWLMLTDEDDSWGVD